jgi:hypothetical protein
MTTKRRLPFRFTLPALILAAGAALVPAAPAFAEDDEGIRQAVIRVSYTSGRVAFSRGDDADHWQDAVINVPLTLGDRLWTEKSARAELQAPGARIVVAPETQLSILDLREAVAQLSLSVGTAAFRIRHLAEGEIFEVDTPNAAVTLRTPGRYRVFVDEDGNTRVDVSEGSAVAAVGGDLAELHGGDGLMVRGLEAPVYELDTLGASDAFDRWANERDLKQRNASSVQYVGGGIAGIEDLDAHGRWERIPEHGWAWSPRVVGTGWMPYRDGRWIWQDPWGWTWVSRERWGWAPYHYGSWVFSSTRWWWVPFGPRVRYSRYAPARVAFFGAGPGRAVVRTGPASYVGWFPVHPRDRFVPWWGPRAAVTVTTATYVNRSHVTVVQRETFVGGGYVRETHLRDAHLVREVSAAPVWLGPLPFVPTIASVRFATPALRHDAVRPPERYLDRHVTTHLPPPPRPPSFDAKLGFIRESQGRPYDHTQSGRHTAGAPAPGPQDTRHAKPEPKPRKEQSWQRDAKGSGAKPQPTPRPQRPEGSSQTTRHGDREPTRPAGPAARPPTPSPGPWVKHPANPPGPAVKAPTPKPTPRPTAAERNPAVPRAVSEKPAVSKAPPEKKTPPPKEDDHRDHAPQPN